MLLFLILLVVMLVGAACGAIAFLLSTSLLISAQTRVYGALLLAAGILGSITVLVLGFLLGVVLSMVFHTPRQAAAPELLALSAAFGFGGGAIVAGIPACLVRFGWRWIQQERAARNLR